MFADSDLAMARREFAATCTTRCVIERETDTGVLDALGGTEFVSERVKAFCSVRAFRSPREVVSGGQVIGTADYAVSFAFGTVIGAKDVVVTEGDGAARARFEVIGVDRGSERFLETANCVRRGG